MTYVRHPGPHEGWSSRTTQLIFVGFDALFTLLILIALLADYRKTRRIELWQLLLAGIMIFLVVGTFWPFPGWPWSLLD